jgi:SOS-response transcriptional repressor LexA
MHHAGVDAHQIRKNNLKTLEKWAGGRAELARRAGVNKDYLTQIASDNIRRNMGSAIARKLEKAAGKKRGWMDTDHSAEGGPDIKEALPLTWVRKISWTQAGNMSAVDNRYTPPGDGEQRVPTTKAVSERSFALKVEGDSMVNPHGRPSYPPDCTIIVDPEKQWVSGDRVVVKIDGTEKATFKQIVQDAGRTYLKSLNPQYPMLEWNESMHVIGVVVQTVIDE